MRALLLLFCVALTGCGRECVDNVVCVQGAHWDSDQCTCVLPDAGVPDGGSTDLAGACTANCGGGGPGCAAQCTGCTSGELCCAWAGGACILEGDAGMCSAPEGYKCAKATAAGVCPSQCYP